MLLLQFNILKMFSIVKARAMRNFSHLCWRNVLVLDVTHFNKFALSTKLCVSGLIEIYQILMNISSLFPLQ